MRSGGVSDAPGPSRIDAEYDVAIVGLGGLGSASAYWLARAGVRAVGFEQFELGHVRGASHDHSRIIRRSYHTPEYVTLAAGAYDAWNQVRNDGGVQLITRTGGVDLFRADSAIAPQPYRTSLEACDVPYEWIDAGEIRKRWRAFDRGTVVADDVMAIYSADTGIVPAGRGTSELHRLAIMHGAALRPHCLVRSMRIVDPSSTGTNEIELEIVRDGIVTVVRAGAVIVCADAWTNRLLAPLEHAIPLAVLREQVTYFPVRSGETLDDLQPQHFPVWIWMDDPSFYGFPVYGVADAAKGAEDCGGQEVDPDTRTFDADPVMERRLGTFMADLLGDRFGTPRTTTCLYTLTSDRDFVVDRLPGISNISVGLGAAHGFKFAAWFGRELAVLAQGASRGDHLTPFRFDRPSLHAPIDRAAWMV